MVSDTSITMTTRVAMSEIPKKLTAEPFPPPAPEPDPSPAAAERLSSWSETISLGSTLASASSGMAGRSGRENSVGRAVDILSWKVGLGLSASNWSMFIRC